MDSEEERERERWREMERERVTEMEREMERERVTETVLVEKTGQHPATVLKGLNRLRLNKELCDVVLCCGGQEFPCHRAVLASFSSYFQAMFTCGMLESRQDRVNIHGVEAHILDLLLTYAYTSEVAIPKEHVQDMLAAAHMLDVLAVQRKCSSYMQRHIDNSNCLGINSFAVAHSFEYLERSSMYYIIHHFGDVYMQEEFLSLPVDKVTKILSHEALNVPKEEAVFDAAMLWINKCPTRRQHFEKFLGLIRLPLISPSYLHDAMESLEVVKESPCCQRLISEAMEQHRLPYSETVHPRRTKEVIVMVGGQSAGNLLDDVECVDFGKWKGKEPIYKGLARLPFEVNKHGLAVLVEEDHQGQIQQYNALYVAGGELLDSQVSTNLWRYNPSHDDSWTMMASMNEARVDFGLVVLDGYLWAVGGQESSGCFVERYDPRTNTWQLNQDMPRCSNHPVVVALDGLIYVFGTGSPDTDTAQLRPYKQRRICGKQVSGSTHRLEAHGGYVPAYKYNPKTSEWTEVAPMQFPRSGSAACTLNGKIYVIGGKCSSVITDKVECYDPRTNKWTMCASLWHSCCYSGVVAMAGKIYVLDGLVGSCNQEWIGMDSYQFRIGSGQLPVQEYCDQTGTWRSVYEPHGSRTTCRSFFSCVSLWLSRDVNEYPVPKECDPYTARNETWPGAYDEYVTVTGPPHQSDESLQSDESHPSDEDDSD